MFEKINWSDIYLISWQVKIGLSINIKSDVTPTTPTEMRTPVKCRTVFCTECYSIYRGLSPVYLLLSERPADARLQTGVPSPPHLAPRTPVSPLSDTLLAALAAPVAATLPVSLLFCSLWTCDSPDNPNCR